ncbi:phosphopantetheine-binding protein [Streptomyces zhihengii]
MVPGQLGIVDRLPLTANGKVDTGRIAELLSAPSPDGAADGPAPDDKVLRRLAELWEELLDVRQAGPDADFFALGGNSLLALRLVNRVRTELGTAVPFGRIFEAPTLRAFAAAVHAGTGPAACAVTLSDGTDPGGRPLVLFHPVGGSVACYRDLAQVWPGPVHAFQSRMLAGAPAPRATGTWRR